MLNPDDSFGLKPHHRQLLVDILKTYTPNAEVWVYGSRITGKAHDTSDLDIVLRNPEGLQKRQEKLYDIKEAIRESNIPILVDVMDWAIIPKYFHEQILAKHEPLEIL